VTIVKGGVSKDLLKATQWADWGVNVRYKKVNIFCAYGPVINNKIVSNSFCNFFEAFIFKFRGQQLLRKKIHIWLVRTRDKLHPHPKQ
jgi:hypothetical protein